MFYLFNEGLSSDSKKSPRKRTTSRKRLVDKRAKDVPTFKLFLNFCDFTFSMDKMLNFDSCCRMKEIKDTQRATVRIGYDGRVHKTYRGDFAKERFQNEVRVLDYLADKGCDFVPALLDRSEEELSIVTSNCGQIVDSISKEKEASVFAQLEKFGVKHGDAFARNITYSPHKGSFCVIDFEFATIIETGEGLTQDQTKRTDYERKK